MHKACPILDQGIPRKGEKNISENDLKISSIALLLDSLLILYLFDRYF